jgi:hypothetical protein
MGITTSADIAPALSLLYSRPRVSQINFGSTLLHLLQVVPGDGKAPTFTAEFTGQSNASASAEAARRSYSDADAEVEVPGTIPWAIYDKVASVSGLARAASANTRKTFDAASLLGEASSLAGARVQRAYNRVVKGIAGDLFAGSGTSPQSVTGLASAVDSTGTYAGIAPGDYAEWAAAECSIAAADFSFDAINTDLLTPMFKACGEMPSVIVCDPDTFPKYLRLYSGTGSPFLREFTLPGAVTDDRVYADRVVKIAAGMQAIDINGITVIRDLDCTANTSYALNLRYLYLTQLLEIPEVFLDANDMQEYFRQLTGNASLVLPATVAAEMLGMVRNPQGIVPFFKKLGAGGDSDEILVKAYIQQMVTRRNAMGKIHHV